VRVTPVPMVSETTRAFRLFSLDKEVVEYNHVNVFL
jgi:hypothetical protein